MDPVQPPPRDPVPHAGAAEPERAQLRERHDTVLLQSERSDPLVKRGPVTLRPIYGRNVTGLEHAPILVGRALRISRRLRRICA
jgi:hypothetical protein